MAIFERLWEQQQYCLSYGGTWEHARRWHEKVVARFQAHLLPLLRLYLSDFSTSLIDSTELYKVYGWMQVCTMAASRNSVAYEGGRVGGAINVFVRSYRVAITSDVPPPPSLDHAFTAITAASLSLL